MSTSGSKAECFAWTALKTIPQHRTSITATPTFQYGAFYFRGDVSWAHASSYAPGTAFGKAGTNANQVRGMAEVGFILGHNVMEK